MPAQTVGTATGLVDASNIPSATVDGVVRPVLVGMPGIGWPSGPGRTALEARVVHIPDVLADPDYTWSEAQKIGGYRAALGVPLLRKGDVAGVIFVAKTVPQPFTAKQRAGRMR
jgi:GAF domain-containing protein